MGTLVFIVLVPELSPVFEIVHILLLKETA